MKIRDVLANRALQTVAILLIVGACIYFKARQNYLQQDPVNSNFFSFWLSGHMVWTGQSPYDPAQFQAGFDAFNATYRPSKILQYPLPLMYVLAPLGLLPVGAAYFAWQLAIQVTIAIAVFALLRNDPGLRWLFPVLTLTLLFFGPVYLSLQVGSIGAIALLAVALAIVFLQQKRPFLAGLVLALTFLKPPQALTLMALAGAWFLMRREWKAIGGVLTGGLLLLAVWMLRDPQWLVKFRGSSDNLLGHTLGVQSNVFGFAYLACGKAAGCMWIIGAISAVVIMLLATLLLWRHRTLWDDWQAFNLIIPIGFLCAVYLWSYDQLLYVIPIVWITAQLSRRRYAAIGVAAFLVVLDVISFVALGIQAVTQQDLSSLSTTMLVLAMCLWLRSGQGPSAATGQAAALTAAP